MATIGTFKKVGEEFHGEVITFSVQSMNVRIVPIMDHEPEGPSHRVMIGRAELGAAWPNREIQGRSCLSVSLDDPSFIGPIVADLIEQTDSETFSLVWIRQTP